MARILVVEDEPRMCRLVSRALEKDGHAVETAGTGIDALRLEAKNHYALVVLDLRLPELDGLEVLRQWQESHTTPRVLVISAIGDVAAKLKCFKSGAVDYLAKPFEVAELVARVRVHADHTATETVRRWLTVGAISLDLDRRTATINGRRVDLSQREFLLLSHLMRRAGQVCRREELLAEVWGYNTPSNVLDVYVRRLRTKLDPSQIETVRHVGYSFTE